VLWTPDGVAERMLKDAVINESYALALIDGGATQITWQVKSPYPYAMDSTEITTAINATLTNGGTAEFWPVIQVSGGGAFTITNTSVDDEDGNPLAIVYTGSYSGYAEIDCFNGTIFENGNGANLSGDIDFSSTDYFWLQPGANALTITGGTANVLWQDAWA
jgi:phage-related protein